MSNRDRAVEVIRTWQQRHKTEMDNNPDWAAQNLAGDLADAGLITPDLPEPDESMTFVPDGKGWLPGGPHGPSVWTAPGGHIAVQRIEPGDLTPKEAREVAHALLAAADYSEGNRE